MKSIIAALIGMLIQAPMQFEVASVKRNTGRPGPTMLQMPPSGRVTIVNATFRTLLRVAYRLQDYQIVGGPDWLDQDRFDIQATPGSDYQPEPFLTCIDADCPVTKNQIMMQRLLADRFQLKSQRETRDLPIYELTIAKSGFKLKEVAAPSPIGPGAALPPPPPPPPPPGTAPPTNPASLPTPPPGIMMNFGVGIAASAVQLTALTSSLSQILGRRVIDKTGLKGHYDFKIVFSREGLPNGLVPPPPGGPGAGLEATDPRPSIFTAVQEQLGLKLDSTKGPVEVLLIDSVSKPTEN